MAETARQQSAGLRKKSEPAKQTRLKKQKTEGPDRADLANRFGPGGDLSTGLDQYNRWVLLQKDDKTGDQYVVYLDVNPNGRDWEIVTGTDIIKRVKAAYGNQEALRKVLFDKGFLSENEYNTRSTSALNGAIVQAATAFSTEVADSYTTEGKIKFPTFSTWMSGLGSAGAGDKPDRPRRDIDLMDRDVIRALVEEVYMDNNMQLPDDPNLIDEKVNRYMDMIEKGVLTTVKTVKGEDVVKRTKGFSEARLRAELGKEIPTENPAAYQKAQSLNFLTFLDQMEQR